MKYVKTLLTIATLSILYYSCETQSIETIETKTSVVEGYLYAGKSIDSLKITQSFSYTQLDTTIIALDGLDVTISEGADQYALTSLGNGRYQNTDLIVEQDKSYRLEFLWEGEVVSSETYVPLKKEAQQTVTEVELPKIELGTFGNGQTTTIDPIQITWDNTEGDYYYVVVTNIETDPEYINENVAANVEATGQQSRFVLITEPEIIDLYAISPQRQFIQYGTHEIVVFRVNPEYAALYQSLGSSSLSLEEPPTNIDNGLGIFTGVSSDTLYVEVKKI